MITYEYRRRFIEYWQHALFARFLPIDTLGKFRSHHGQDINWQGYPREAKAFKLLIFAKDGQRNPPPQKKKTQRKEEETTQYNCPEVLAAIIDDDDLDA